MPFAKGNKLAGSRRGRPNRATRTAREAIAQILDAYVHRLPQWLNDVAQGVREPPAVDGTPGKWIVRPDPARAFELVLAMLEYNLPKLSRVETVREDKPNGRVIDSSQLTAEQRQQLRQILLEQIGTKSELLGQHR